ncbi:hypothetical protein D9613_004902 [Agrocybe pediades]|uniref:F-box domain-containing protein n=1 Tax=Agrocybe pediades TaxID=84607 RepID=A0A8H4QZU8_9AGAR|nr:hypothetical protein D9613_004902 [Agrocybe pediades]
MSLEVAHVCPLKKDGRSTDDAQCACNQVDSLKEEIPRLEETLSQRRIQMQQVLIRMNERHSALGSFPTEIISTIFKAYLESGEVTIESKATAKHYTKALFSVLVGVCHRWRAIALSDPSLWKTVYVCIPDRMKGNEELELFEKEGMTRWLARSKALPLDIKVYSESDDYERMDQWKALFGVVQKHSSRWRTLELYPFQVTLPLRPDCWGFEVVSPQIPDAEAEINDLARIPSLTYLRCDVILKLNNENLSAEWKYLTRLRFDKIAVEDAGMVLRKAINVVECEFTFHQPHIDYPPSSHVAHVRAVHSSRLKSLTIGCVGPRLPDMTDFFLSGLMIFKDFDVGFPWMVCFASLVVAPVLCPDSYGTSLMNFYEVHHSTSSQPLIPAVSLCPTGYIPFGLGCLPLPAKSPPVTPLQPVGQKVYVKSPLPAGVQIEGKCEENQGPEGTILLEEGQEATVFEVGVHRTSAEGDPPARLYQYRLAADLPNVPITNYFEDTRMCTDEKILLKNLSDSSALKPILEPLRDQDPENVMFVRERTDPFKNIAPGSTGTFVLKRGDAVKLMGTPTTKSGGGVSQEGSWKKIRPQNAYYKFKVMKARLSYPAKWRSLYFVQHDWLCATPQ